MPEGGASKSTGSAAVTPPTTATRLAMASGVSGEADAAVAAEQVCEAIGGRLAASAAEQQPDMAVVFISGHHVAAATKIGRIVARRLSPRVLMGVSGEAVIGGGRELEGSPGVAVLAGVMPGVEVTPFCADDLPLAMGMDEDADDDRLAPLAETMGMRAGLRGVLLFADPFSVAADRCLTALTRARDFACPRTIATTPTPLPAMPAAPILGGFASAAQRPGGNALLLGDRVLHSGLVGLSLRGDLRVDTVVSQGCRAFGPVMVITAAKGQVIRSLSGKPALEMVHEAIETLTDEERKGLSRGMFVGRVVDEYKERFGPGDYLIRGVIGVSKEGGAIAVADNVRVGQSVRLHMRDAAAADADLAMLLDAQSIHERPEGVLLVTCNGRGSRLFRAPHHDAGAIQRAFAEPSAGAGEQRARGGTALPEGESVPLAGFFAAGEIGPIGDGVFIHGQTACAAVFRRG